MPIRSGKNSTDKNKLPIIAAFCLLVGVLWLVSFSTSHSSAKLTTEPQASSQGRRTQRSRTPSAPRIDYSQFSHTTHVEKQKLKCDSCHKVPTKNWKDLRKGDATFPDVGEFPEHGACLNCHRQQFFARERPAPAICSNCHIAVTPRDTTRWLFPSLGDLTDPKLKRRDAASEFGVGFPHDKHLEVVGFSPRRRHDNVFTTASFRERSEDATKSCAICHQTYQPQGNSSDEYFTKPPKNLGDAFWLKKGTFKTIPNSHTTCFTCHNPDSGIAPESKDCNGCHKLLPAGPKPRVDFESKLSATMGVSDRMILGRWSRRISAGAFRHEGGAHPDVSCLNCHNVTAMNTLQPQTIKVAVGSCGGAEGCHVTATTDDGGALNFEIDQKKKDASFVCTKCHIVFGRDVVPESHLKALPTPTPPKKPGT